MRLLMTMTLEKLSPVIVITAPVCSSAEEKYLRPSADLSVQVITIGIIVRGVNGAVRLNVATIALQGVAQDYLPAMVYAMTKR